MCSSYLRCCLINPSGLINGLSPVFLSVCVPGARVNAKDNKWLTPLHRAVASCSEVRVLILTHTPVHMCFTVKYVVIFKCTLNKVEHDLNCAPVGGSPGAIETLC